MRIRIYGGLFSAYFDPLRVRAAFRPAFFFARTVLTADWCRALRPRRCAADLACRDRLACDAADLPSLFSAPKVARERTLEGLLLADVRPFAVSRRACARVFAEVAFGAGKATPARRAFESPMAMACCGDRAPCFPLRMCSISSRTNSPAWVLGALPCLLSSRARSITSSSGI
jgi:hypothetical protein